MTVFIMKHCIFYLPYELDPSAARARMVRPRKMIQAFRSIGYDVFEDCVELREITIPKNVMEIKNVVNEVKNEYQYEFVKRTVF